MAHWLAAQSTIGQEIVKGTVRDITDMVLDGLADVAENTVEQNCAAEDVAQMLTDEHRIQYIYWFAA